MMINRWKLYLYFVDCSKITFINQSNQLLYNRLTSKLLNETNFFHNLELQHTFSNTICHTSCYLLSFYFLREMLTECFVDFMLNRCVYTIHWRRICCSLHCGLDLKFLSFLVLGFMAVFQITKEVRSVRVRTQKYVIIAQQ